MDRLESLSDKDRTMQEKKIDAEQTWKDMEDRLIPRLKLGLSERAVYSQLVRHSRLEGHRRFHFSVNWLCRLMRLSSTPVRRAVRILSSKGALRIHERSHAGHVVDVLLPAEIAACREAPAAPGEIDLEAVDFTHSRELRDAIHRRERARCFYCFRFLSLRVRALDHVVPRAKNGQNSYRNLVSCCTECNARKGEMAAEDFLRKLFRERRLNPKEFNNRLRDLAALASGKLKPMLPAADSARQAKRGRPQSAA